MKGFFNMKWESEHHQPKEEFEFDKLEEIMGIKIPEDFKDFQYRNNNSRYPDRDNYNLYDENGEIAVSTCGQERIVLDYTHCKENPLVVLVNEEIGPYEDELGDPQWKRYIAPTFKDFIEMIGDRNKPVGEWIDQDLMADGSRQERE